jgi:hypothetical protein
MKKIKTLAVLSFVAFLGFGVASCFNPAGPSLGGLGGNGDTTIRKLGDSIIHILRGDSTIHTGGGVGDTGIHRDSASCDTTAIHRHLPPPPPPPPDSGRDSLRHRTSTRP